MGGSKIPKWNHKTGLYPTRVITSQRYTNRPIRIIGRFFIHITYSLNDTNIMQKREQTLSPIGEVITAERKALGIRVVDFCREAHVSRVTYYELLKGNTTP